MGLDIGTIKLHNMARIDTIQQRRDLSLLCMMYELKQLHLYERVIKQDDKYTFQPDIAAVGVYTRSPYYIGANLWNNLPVNIQQARTKAQFKCEVKPLLN